MSSKAPKELELTASKNWEPEPDEWKSIADMFGPRRPPTPLERQAIAEVYELAHRFTDSSATTAEIRAATSPRQRNLATRYTTPTMAEWRPLMAMLDALIASEPSTVVTQQGTFVLGDLIAAGMRILRQDGQEVIQFPKFWPWRVEPDADRGIEGVRGEAYYRSLDDRGPTFGSFGNAQPAELRQQAAEWWEMASTDEVPF